MGEADGRPLRRTLRQLTGPLLWLGLNLVWTFAMTLPAKHTIHVSNGFMDADQQASTVSIPDIVGDGRQVQVEVRCEFAAANGLEHDVAWRFEDRRESVLASWEGGSDDPCDSQRFWVQPVNHVLVVTVPENSAWDRLEVEVRTYLYEPLRVEGYVVANALGALIMVSEVVSAMRRRRRAKHKEETPRFVSAMRQERAMLLDEMAGDRHAEVESFPDLAPMGADPLAEQRRRAMQQQVAQLAQQRRDQPVQMPPPATRQPFAAQPPVEGSTRGLEGEVTADERIRTVSDIYALMEGHGAARERRRERRRGET